MGADLVFPVLWDEAQGVGFSAAIWAVALAFPRATASALCLPVPIPLGGVQWMGSRLPPAKLWLSKGKLEGSSRWIQRLQVTPTMAFLSLPVFVAAKEHIKSEAAQLEGFPLPPQCLQSFFSGSQCSGMFSHFYSLCDAALHTKRTSVWLHMWRVGSGILSTISLVIKRYA